MKDISTEVRYDYKGHSKPYNSKQWDIIKRIESEVSQGSQWAHSIQITNVMPH